MMPRLSGSRMTTALPLPMPRAKPSIHAPYAAPSTAPPAEYWAQSRKGTLYATRIGTLRARSASVMVFATAFATSLGVPLENQTACGVVANVATWRASLSLRARIRSITCLTAAGFGGGAKNSLLASDSEVVVGKSSGADASTAQAEASNNAVKLKMLERTMIYTPWSDERL